ncbi:probable catabolite repression protein creC [Andrographis paniculata]|uniref:probable catabolite repression protein creC n=1 Tax=Andrographis paniculata TaxID=175694 RepID=UPI0021E7BC5D|nr:probable catabolite repression protein creC [Andrographis paniculata]XP_051130384.1 probable catabolite repression protein creC [Andrographis paniculata]
MNSAASNNLASSASAPGSNAPPGLKTHFKTPEGRYKLQCEKTHPSALIQQPQSKTVTQVSLAHLKDKPVQAPSQSSSGSGVSSGVRSAAARLWGGGNGSRALSHGGGNGGSRLVATGCTRIGSLAASSSSNNAISNANFDGKGTYLVFNVNDSIFLSDLNSQDKDPIKSIHFSNSNPICHAYDPDAKDGHDLLIGLSSGDVYSVSLRQQFQDVGKKLVGAQHYNKDGCVNNSRCTSVAWIPNGVGSFLAAHADGNLYLYEKNKDISGDSAFPAIKDQTQFFVSHARNNKNPVARWHISEGSINSVAFSSDGAYVATVGRDGYLRVFDYKNEELIFGGKSYYGALLCCTWSNDGKYVLTGGEDDLVHVWSMEDRKIVAWGEGHNSWVSRVAFDSHWVAPSSDSISENIVYRFGSVGQDAQLLLWDFEMDELIVPVRRLPGGSPTFSAGSRSSHWDGLASAGTLRPAPSIRDVPKLSPLVVHRVHTEPLSGLIFVRDSVLTASRDGHIKIWSRPDSSGGGSKNPENTSLK